jgi:hypothetical protein
MFYMAKVAVCSEIHTKQIVSQLVKKFPTFYGIRRFITAFTRARHLSLFSASSIQSMPIPLLEDPF